MTLDERLQELELAQERLAESQLFLTGRLDMLTQQISRMTETIMRGFTAMTSQHATLRSRLTALEDQVAKLEKAG